ncbi:MAG TPA: ADOP family duplicated permease [Vicinamibacterales bacterium]
MIHLWLATISEVVALSARLRFDQFRTDLRHSVRGLLRQKTFTITAVATLALALAPMTAVLTLINGVLLNPLPGAKALDRVVVAYSENTERNRFEFPWSELNFADHRARKQGLSAFGAFIDTSATIGSSAPQQVTGAWVSEDMFEVLGVSVARGRPFTAADTQPGAAPTIILGHEYAQTRFPAGDAVGQSLIVDGRPTQIIGVLPEGLRFPEGDGNFWQPLIINPATSNRAQTYLRTIGRLADGATPELVQQHMNRIAEDLAKQYPESNAGYTVSVKPAAQQFTRGARRIITVLGLAAVAIFLLACTNIASLVVVRTAGRQAEFSVRTALGASAARLSRQLLIENLALAALAAVASIAVLVGLRRLLVLGRLMSQEAIDRAGSGAAPFAFLIALTILTGVLLGWVVSRRAARIALSPGLRTVSAARETVRLRQALVGIEVGAAVVLLLAAGLLLQSASRLMAIDPGFRAGNVITFQIGMPMNRYEGPLPRIRFVEAVVDKLRNLPGVSDAASGAYAPMGSTRATRRFAIAGKPLPEPGTEPLAIDLPAGPTYASVMGLRVIDGRWISERDRPDSPPVVVVSESFAKQYFPGQRAVGQRLQYYGSSAPNAPPPPRPEIVGVVSDVRQFGMAEREAPQMYVPHAQRVWGFTSFFVRTAGDPRAVIASLPAAVQAIDPERPLERVRTLEQLISASTADRRALSGLLLIAAVVALLISTLGVYGVTAATTAARRRELAIRAAIGANRAGLITLVVRQGLTAAIIGVAIGIAGAFAASSVLESVLFEVKSRDPWTFATVGLGLLAVCAIATYLPARQAVSDSPAVTLNDPA